MTEQPTASLNFPRSVSGNPIRWLIVGGGFLIAAIAIGATVMAGNFRERALNSSARELDNTVLLLARHFDQQLQDFGAIQQDVATYVQSAGIETSEHYRRRMSSADIHLMLKAKIDALSYVGSVNLFDAGRRDDQFLHRLAGRGPSTSPTGPFSRPSSRTRNRPRCWSNRSTAASPAPGPPCSPAS